MGVVEILNCNDRSTGFQKLIAEEMNAEERRKKTTQQNPLKGISPSPRQQRQWIAPLLHMLHPRRTLPFRPTRVTAMTRPLLLLLLLLLAQRAAACSSGYYTCGSSCCECPGERGAGQVFCALFRNAHTPQPLRNAASSLAAFFPAPCAAICRFCAFCVAVIARGRRTGLPRTLPAALPALPALSATGARNGERAGTAALSAASVPPPKSLIALSFAAIA